MLELKKMYSLQSLSNKEEIKEIADILSEFIRSNNLFTVIERVNKKTGEVNTKHYANVESWLYAGTLLQLRAIPGKPEDISTEGFIRYSCTVEVMDFSGEAPVLVSRGTSLADSKEGFFKYAKAFAINSMSQTRAIGKAYRNLIGHLLKVAGFEATPSEEMKDIKSYNKKSGGGSGLISKEALTDLIKAALESCSEEKNFKKITDSLGALTKDPGIRSLLGEKYKELQWETLKKLEGIEQDLDREKEESPEEEAARIETENRESNN